MKVFFAGMLAMALIACAAEPEPLKYGEDTCHHCKMTLADRKFGAELVTKKGKIYKFDDVNCMMNFLNAPANENTVFTHKLVTDFSRPGTLINATEAFYLKSAGIQSPMASQVAAFEKESSMEEVKSKVNGIYLVWGELVSQFK